MISRYNHTQTHAQNYTELNNKKLKIKLKPPKIVGRSGSEMLPEIKMKNIKQKLNEY
jgi:hypothetical protein